LRLDLDILLSPFTPPPPSKANEVQSHKSTDHQASVGRRDSKMDAKRSEISSVISASPLGAEEEYWKQR
jgi:hypothetical protein